MVSQQIVEELKTIIKEDYGKEVSQAEASEIIRTLVGYFDLLAKIYHRDNFVAPEKREFVNAIKKGFSSSLKRK